MRHIDNHNRDRFSLRVALTARTALTIAALCLTSSALSDPPVVIPGTGPSADPKPGHMPPVVDPNPTAGFRYDPNDLIWVFDGVVFSNSYSNAGDGTDSDHMDDQFGNISHVPTEYGPNVFSDNIFFHTYIESTLDDCAEASAEDNAVYSYSITANQTVISFSANHMANGSTASAARVNYCGNTPRADFNGGYPSGYDNDLSVRIPFSVSENGYLFVEQADLTLLAVCTGEGNEDASGHSLDAYASWHIREAGGSSTGIGSDGDLTVYDHYNHCEFPYIPDGQQLYDGWEQGAPRRFPIEAGTYEFHAIYDGGHQGCAWAPYDSAASTTITGVDQFTVTIRYLPE